MSDAPLMLGVSGLRGITGRSLTAEVAARYGAAFGGWLGEEETKRRRDGETKRGSPVVVVGADGRAGWPEIHGAVIEGLRSAGCRVVDLGVAMTPTVGVMVDHLDASGGMIVTASHNPQEWNGLKCLVRAAGAGPVDACAPDAGRAGAMIQRYQSSGGGRAANNPEAEGASQARRDDTGARVHLERVTAALGHDAVRAVRSRRVRVLLDSVNGSGRFGGRTLLAASLGCELVHHGAEEGGLFPHPPEPTKENLESLCRGVPKFGAQVGFAQDPDADRLAIVDEQGNYIGEEYTLALAARALLEGRHEGTQAPGGRHEGTKAPEGRHEGTQARRDEGQMVLVTNLSTSRMIEDIAARHGARVVRTPVGEANVVEVMKREAAAGCEVVLGGEGNGGVIWPRVTYVRDSLSAMALVLWLMARTGKSVSQLVGEVPSYAIEKRKVDLARKEDAAPAIAKLQEFYSPTAAAAARGGAAGASSVPRIDLQDGVRLDWDGRLPGGSGSSGVGKAWLHVRASNTEPIMRLIAEAPTGASARAILDEAARVIGER